MRYLILVLYTSHSKRTISSIYFMRLIVSIYRHIPSIKCFKTHVDIPQAENRKLHVIISLRDNCACFFSTRQIGPIPCYGITFLPILFFLSCLFSSPFTFLCRLLYFYFFYRTFPFHHKWIYLSPSGTACVCEACIRDSVVLGPLVGSVDPV